MLYLLIYISNDDSHQLLNDKVSHVICPEVYLDDLYINRFIYLLFRTYSHTLPPTFKCALKNYNRNNLYNGLLEDFKQWSESTLETHGINISH